MSNSANCWSVNQRKFQEWLATPRYERVPPTQALLAKELGLHETTLSRWKQDRDFIEAVNEIAREHLSDDLPEVYGALRREAAKGSHQHIKMFLELVGEYVEERRLTGPHGGPAVESNVNFDLSRLTDKQLDTLLAILAAGADGEGEA